MKRTKRRFGAESENQLPDMVLICKILHILPVEYKTFKTSWMLLSGDKQTVGYMVNHLCTFERDAEFRATSKTNSEALVGKTVVQKSKQQQKFKHQKQGEKQSFNCNYCHEAGHWVKNFSKWIADGRSTKRVTSNKSTKNIVLTVYAEVLAPEAITIGSGFSTTVPLSMS